MLLFSRSYTATQYDRHNAVVRLSVHLSVTLCIVVDWEAAGLMIFRLAYENCGLNPAKPDYFGRLRLS